MEYKAVQDNNLNELSKKINKLILDGWEPFGGVGVTVLYVERENLYKGHIESNTTYLYVQAMVRKYIQTMIRKGVEK